MNKLHFYWFVGCAYIRGLINRPNLQLRTCTGAFDEDTAYELFINYHWIPYMYRWMPEVKRVSRTLLLPQSKARF